MKYYSVYLFAPVAWWGFQAGGAWAFAIPAFFFGIIPLLELALPEDPNRGPDASGEQRETLFKWALYLGPPVHYLLLASFLHRISTQPPQTWEWAGMVWTMGISNAVFGLAVGHELGHRHRKIEQFLARLLLMTPLYVHVIIHHNRVHHAFFGTPQDPNTARPNEPVFAFWVRSVVGSYLSSWKDEARRLRLRQLPFFSLYNEMLRWQPVQLVFVVLIFIAFGKAAGLSFLGAAAISIMMLETVNYIEHYGLFRRRLPNGRFESMNGTHSWDSNHLIGRTLSFHLPRHSDHHLNPAREYQRLTDLDDSPHMPTGYPGMMILAAIPPLFFRVMNPRLEAVLQREDRVSAASRCDRSNRT